jgi:hypothetical protein
MSDSTSLLTALTTAQAGKEQTVNTLFDMVSKVSFGGRRQSSSGLSWDYTGDRIRVDGITTAIANGTVALTASTTNYVEATRAGVFSKNTTAFTAGSIPMYKIVTGTATVTSYEDHRPWLRLAPQRLVKAISDANQTLTYDEASCDILEFTGNISTTRNIVLPLATKQYTVFNNTTIDSGGGDSLQFIGPTGTGVSVAAGKRAIIYANGTNIVRVTADV